MFYVYILKCADGTIYIGQTADLARRFSPHAKGQVTWTKSRRPVALLKAKAYETRAETVKAEKKLKSGFGRKWTQDTYFERVAAGIKLSAVVVERW